MMTARDLMRSCLVVRDDATVAEVVDKIGQWPVCMVVDSRDRVCGILTEHDLAELVYRSGQFDDETTIAGHIPAFLGMSPDQLRAVGVKEIMTENPETVGPDLKLNMLLRIIFRNGRDLLPVVENGQLLGVVHRMDAIKEVLG